MPNKTEEKFYLAGTETGSYSTTRLISAQVLIKKGCFRRVHIGLVGGELVVSTLEKGGGRKEYRITPDW